MATMDPAFATETAAMRTLPFSSGGRTDWGYRTAVGVVSLLAAAQVGSLSYYYISHRPARVATTTTVAPEIATPVPPTPAPVATAAPTLPPVAVLPKPTAAPSIAPATAPTLAPVVAPSATPAIVAATAPPSTPAATAPPSAPSLSASDRLLKEATALRIRGDTTTALARLQEATRKDPKNANVLAEMATIYESVQQYERSNEAWAKIQEIGPSAGASYELAALKLKKGPVATPAPSAAAQTTPIDTAPAPTVAAPTTTAPTSAPPQTVIGIPDGSTFGLAEVKATETPDPDADTNLTLRIGVKKRPNSVVDHTKVKIQVFFYDTVNDRDIKLTDADVNYEWLTPNHDWAREAPEVLAVNYIRSKNKARSQEDDLSNKAQSMIPGKKPRTVKPTTPDEASRKYLGYIVRIYYNDKLQAVTASPTKLLNLFPPPPTATSQ